MKNFISKILLKCPRKILRVYNYKKHYKERRYTYNVQLTGLEAARLIKNKLLSPEPTIIGRFGFVEINVVATYYSMHVKCSLAIKICRFLRGQLLDFWRKEIPEHFINELRYQAGFFPVNYELVNQYAKLVIDELPQIDILASWLENENVFFRELADSIKIDLADLEPFFSEEPWTEVLAGKKVLVVSPFEQTILKQYEKRHLLFEDKRILPNFELHTIKAVQSIVGTQTEFATWFDALEHMKQQISTIDFDIAILGCGAYGMPLCAYVKSLGKKAVYMGGATQLLFGIKGNRWMQWERYRNLFNDHWVFPLLEETPVQKNQLQDGITGGAYFAGNHN